MPPSQACAKRSEPGSDMTRVSCEVPTRCPIREFSSSARSSPAWLICRISGCGLPLHHHRHCDAGLRVVLSTLRNLGIDET
ncbi:unnamed protein product [Protopolystoma xenopodis]|uniref:Uncharacterized protein n=1 Tax=Protopolystoma xenopodis TaxID=117903 RepID=A0A3S5BLQ8_9PLAT|nr:unnamed protein product [Protopolystoma xenopodis]